MPFRQAAVTLHRMFSAEGPDGRLEPALFERLEGAMVNPLLTSLLNVHDAPDAVCANRPLGREQRRVFVYSPGVYNAYDVLCGERGDRSRPQASVVSPPARLCDMGCPCRTKYTSAWIHLAASRLDEGTTCRTLWFQHSARQTTSRGEPSRQVVCHSRAIVSLSYSQPSCGELSIHI